jgi:hypothetical protein
LEEAENQLLGANRNPVHPNLAKRNRFLRLQKRENLATRWRSARLLVDPKSEKAVRKRLQNWVRKIRRKLLMIKVVHPVRVELTTV